MRRGVVAMIRVGVARKQIPQLGRSLRIVGEANKLQEGNRVRKPSDSKPFWRRDRTPSNQSGSGWSACEVAQGG